MTLLNVSIADTALHQALIAGVCRIATFQAFSIGALRETRHLAYKSVERGVVARSETTKTIQILGIPVTNIKIRG